MSTSTSATPDERAQRLVRSIGFRLDAITAQTLAMRAAYLGVSPHALARLYVLEVLNEPEERVLLRQEVETVHKRFELVREDISLAVEVLLTSAGQITPENARKWVARNYESP